MNEQGTMFKGWLLGIIQSIDIGDLIEMIKAEPQIFPQIFEYQLPRYLWGIQTLIADKKNEILKELTLESAVKYSYEYRPDLAQIFEHPRGAKWLNNFLKMIRYIISNIEKEWEQIRSGFFREIQKNKKEYMDNLLKPEPQSVPSDMDTNMSKKNEQKVIVSDNNITQDYF